MPPRASERRSWWNLNEAIEGSVRGNILSTTPGFPFTVFDRIEGTAATGVGSGRVSRPDPEMLFASSI